MNATVHRAPAPRASLITPERYFAAPTFAAYVASTVNNHDWWQSTYRLAIVSDAQIARATALRATWRLLALSEDWCGDAVNSLPYVARLADAATTALELRVLGRDANPDVMNAHLTGRSRSIPIVLALDSEFVEHGWWGPRPLALQLQAMGEWWLLSKEERRLRIRAWYARNHGREVLTELLDLLEAASPTK